MNTTDDPDLEEEVRSILSSSENPVKDITAFVQGVFDSFVLDDSGYSDGYNDALAYVRGCIDASQTS